MKEGDTFFRAWIDTRSFNFEGYGTTAWGAKKACYRAWCRHVKECQKDPQSRIERDYVKMDDISATQCELGGSYRDYEKIERVK